MQYIKTFAELSENFKHEKDQDIYKKIHTALKDGKPMSQLALCKAVGFPTYDMRTTMVVREMTQRQELIVDKTTKPMTYTLNPEYKEGSTTRLEAKPKDPNKIASPRGLKAKKELAETIKSELDGFRPAGGGYYDKENAEVNDYKGRITIKKGFRDLGNWESDYENHSHDDDNDEGWDEDDDQKVWQDGKKYRKIFDDWVKQKSWKRYVKSAGVETSEKSWCYFTIELK